MPRVLHVVESLDRGAVEGWLIRMLRHGVRRGVPLDWTFYSIIEKPGAREAEAQALGARLLRTPAPLQRKLDFMRGLRSALRAGSYDVLHCHHDLMSAVYLVASAGLPIPLRIVHAHNADEVVPTGNERKAAVVRPVLRQVCRAMADRIVGISDHTLDTILGGKSRRPGRDIVHYYGIEEPSGMAGRGRAAMRAEFGFPADALILLFLGRLVPEKNPLFAAEVFGELATLEPRAVGLFVGAGSEVEPVETRIRQLGLATRVRFAGWRDDVGGLMAASDWFILPRPEHPKEGFGIAVVEAQLAGLRLLLSKGIPDDPLLPSAIFRRLAIADGVTAWARAAIELAQCPAPSREAALEMLKASPMDMDFALDRLCRLHEPT